MRGFGIVRFAVPAVLLAACTSAPSGPGQTPTASNESASLTRLASGQPLPGTCSPAQPSGAETGTFLADGHVWAIDSTGQQLACLFNAQAPGSFQWGPLGDRLLLGGLRIRGIRGAPNRPSLGITPGGPAAWGHPIGIAVVFVAPDGSSLHKIFLSGQPETLDPVPGARYLDVIYHPSGLALAFVVDKNGRQSVWLSSNEGKDPRRLVFSKEGTEFTGLAFTPDGKQLLYTAEHAAGYPELHSIDLARPNAIPSQWKGDVGQRVQELFLAPQGAGIAVTLGTSCDDAQALIIDGHDAQHPALPDETRPTRVVGWLDPGTLLVAIGGCHQRQDLSAVDVSSGSVTPLVSKVQAAAVRTPAPKAPSSLPHPVEQVGSGAA
jgi:hypothetical protein